jgi:hypothetical protein
MNDQGVREGDLVRYQLDPKNRQRVVKALRDAGYVLRDEHERAGTVFRYKVWDPKRVKLDNDGLVADDGYVATLNTKRVDARVSTGIEPVLKNLNLPAPRA